MRFLVATDGSPAAAIGIRQATRWAGAAGAELRIVAAVPPAADLLGGSWATVAVGGRTRAEAAARSMLAHRVQAELGAIPPGIIASSAIVEGRPADAILAEARRCGADVIVVGARGHGALASMLLGSVSEEVVDRSPVPTLVARQPGLDRIVVAVDGSPASESAVELVASPAFRGLEGWVVDVAPTSHPWWVGMAAADAANLERLAEIYETAGARDRAAAEAASAKLRAAGLLSNSCHRIGDAADEIIRAAAEVGADTIVIGSRGLTGVTRLILGSVARKVLRHSEASVLVVHPVVTAPLRSVETPAAESDPVLVATAR
ncbi:MAG TPA: universal stress protein [Candidatus Limnocylindrales bacterium]